MEITIVIENTTILTMNEEREIIKNASIVIADDRIKEIGENKMGDITYTVIVIPDEQDDRLRWNMTATVVIEPQ